MTYDLTIIPTGKFGPRGEKYDVEFAGEVIASGASPEFTACRVLSERGFTGMARFWRTGKSHWDLTAPIGSKRTVVEGSKAGPRLGKFVPFTATPDAWAKDGDTE